MVRPGFDPVASADDASDGAVVGFVRYPQVSRLLRINRHHHAGLDRPSATDLKRFSQVPAAGDLEDGSHNFPGSITGIADELDSGLAAAVHHLISPPPLFARPVRLVWLATNSMCLPPLG